MSLTEEAYRDRMWGFIPVLRQVLEDKKIPDHYYGFTSADDNIIDRIDRLMHITVLLLNHKSDIREKTQFLEQEDREAIIKDLRTVEQHLEGTSDFLLDAVRKIRAIYTEF